MRQNEQESAAVVLERLQAAKPQPPTYVYPHNKRPHQDPTFDGRLQAWQEAVSREEARLQAEKTGTLAEHLEALRLTQDHSRKLRLTQERQERAARKAAEVHRRGPKRPAGGFGNKKTKKKARR